MTAHCSTCSCESTKVPPPATSSEWARRQALEAVEQAVRAARESRKKPAATCTRCGDTTAAGCEDWDCHKGWSA